MFKRDWLFAVVLGLIAASLQAQEQANRAQPAEQQSGQQAKAFEPSIPVRIIESEESARARESRERESNQREKDDLIAQQRMADATEAMNDATQSMKNAAWWSFGAVALGTALLVYTLLLTREANKSAREAVEVTRKIGQAQVRAYISVVSIHGQPIPNHSGTRFTVRIRNTGASPAFRTQAIIFGRFLKDYSEKDIRFSDFIRRPIRTDFGAGEEKVLHVDIDDWEFITSSSRSEQTGLRGYCFVYVTYYDAFDRKRLRRTIISARQDGWHGDTGFMSFSACERGNRSS